MLWQSTTSSRCTSSIISARCSAAVPELNAATCVDSPRKCSISFSNPFTCGPSGAIQLVSKASFTYCCSFSPMCGEESQSLSFIYIVSFYNSSRVTHYGTTIGNILNDYRACAYGTPSAYSNTLNHARADTNVSTLSYRNIAGKRRIGRNMYVVLQ